MGWLNDAYSIAHWVNLNNVCFSCPLSTDFSMYRVEFINGKHFTVNKEDWEEFVKNVR